jgi:PAS domain S-box-containing protein
MDQDGKIIYANRFAARTLGVPPSELVGIEFFGRFAEAEHIEVQRGHYQRVMRTGQAPKEMVGRIVTANGGTRQIRFKNSLIRDGKGKVTGMSIMGEDITELLKAQEERDMLAYAVKASTNEVYLFDADDLRFTFVNEGALRNLGMTKEEVLGRQPSILRPNFDMNEFISRLDVLRQHQADSVAYESVHQCKDGQLYPVEVRLQMFEKGGNRFFLGVAQDITARKSMEDELRVSEARYRNLVENFSGTVFVAELDSKYPMNVYGQVKDLTGYDAADFEQHRVSWVDVILPEDLHILLEQIKLIDMDHSVVARMEFRIRRKDGNVRWVTAIWHVVSPQGNPVIQGMMIDVTSQKTIEEELQSSNEELMAAEEELKQQLEEITDSEERLRLSEERFHNLFMAMDEGVAIHRLVMGPEGVPIDYVLLDVNPSYERILGLKKADVQGRTGTDVYHAPSPFLHEFSLPERTGRSHVFETYFPPMDKHFHISVVRVGRERFATVFIDITEQKRREAALVAKQISSG